MVQLTFRWDYVPVLVGQHFGFHILTILNNHLRSAPWESGTLPDTDLLPCSLQIIILFPMTFLLKSSGFWSQCFTLQYHNMRYLEKLVIDLSAQSNEAESLTSEMHMMFGKNKSWLGFNIYTVGSLNSQYCLQLRASFTSGSCFGLRTE